MKKWLMLSLIAMVMLTGCASRPKNLKPDQAKERAEKFINMALMQPGTQATIKEAELTGGFYKLKVDVGSTELIDSYLSRDGQLFFPQAMNIDEITQQLADYEEAQLAAATVENKSDKPEVELFTMSYCPYGLQIERGILPVIKELGDQIDFKLKFCDYAMHDKPEIDENLVQYCIQKEQNDKFLDYLNCFISSGEADNCYKEAKIDQATLKACISATDKQFKITANYNDKDAWAGQFPPFDVNKEDNSKYSVEGSPTLVINGQKINSNRDSASLLKTICSAFNNEPEACSAQLSSESPAAGFNADSGNTAAGSCD